jgi:hypothetical protein
VSESSSGIAGNGAQQCRDPHELKLDTLAPQNCKMPLFGGYLGNL